MIIPAQLTRYNRKADNSYSVTFNTQELTKSQKNELDELFQTFGIMYFRGQEKINKDELEALDAIELDLYDNVKSQAQRIRNTLYVLWEKDNEGYKEFKEYYRNKTNKYIEFLKSKIEE
jgi:hypothetical protein